MSKYYHGLLETRAELEDYVANGGMVCLASEILALAAINELIAGIENRLVRDQISRVG